LLEGRGEKRHMNKLASVIQVERQWKRSDARPPKEKLSGGGARLKKARPKFHSTYPSTGTRLKIRDRGRGDGGRSSLASEPIVQKPGTPTTTKGIKKVRGEGLGKRGGASISTSPKKKEVLERGSEKVSGVT